jgi:hypothetical protein
MGNYPNKFNKFKLISDWKLKEGVFHAPKAKVKKWIVRIFKDGHYRTMAGFNTQEEADNYYKNLKIETTV